MLYRLSKDKTFSFWAVEDGIQRHMLTVTDVRQALVEATEKEFAGTYLLHQRSVFDWKQYWLCAQHFRDDILQPLSMQLYKTMEGFGDDVPVNEISSALKVVLGSYQPKGVHVSSGSFISHDAPDLVVWRFIASLRRCGAIKSNTISFLDELQTLREKNSSLARTLTDALEQVKVLTKQVCEYNHMFCRIVNIHD